MDECKPLLHGVMHGRGVRSSDLSSRPVPVSVTDPLTPPSISHRKCVTVSRKVDDCMPLRSGNRFVFHSELTGPHSEYARRWNTYKAAALAGYADLNTQVRRCRLSLSKPR